MRSDLHGNIPGLRREAKESGDVDMKQACLLLDASKHALLTIRSYKIGISVRTAKITDRNFIT